MGVDRCSTMPKTICLCLFQKASLPGFLAVVALNIDCCNWWRSRGSMASMSSISSAARLGWLML